MNLIILSKPSFIMSGISVHTNVEQLRLLIAKKLNNSDLTILHNNKVLSNPTDKLTDLGIKNNSIITINEKLLGGTISGFPDIGHLVVLYAVALVMLLFIILFFYSIVGEISRPLTDCITMSGALLSSPISINPILQVAFWIILCFYASTLVSIYTLYTYTYWCSDFQMTSSPIITSIIISLSLAIGIIAYYYISNHEISFIKRFFPNYGNRMKSVSLALFTGILAVVSIGFMIHLLFTSISKYILLYPFSVAFSGLLFYFLILGRSYPLSIKIFAALLIFIIPFAFYCYAFVMNSMDKCV